MEKGFSRSAYSRQRSVSNSPAAAAGAVGTASPGSPMMSPNRHVRTGSGFQPNNFRRNQNNATRAAAQRLAAVMARDEDEESKSDEDSEEDLEQIIPVGLSTPRRGAANRNPSPAIGRYLADQTPHIRLSPAARPSMAAKQPALIPPIKPSPRPVITTATSDPPIVSRKELASMASDSPVFNRREKRLSVDLGALNMRDNNSSRSSSIVQDEIDGLQEDTENLLEKVKLRVAEERSEEAESRPRPRDRQALSRNSVRYHDVKNEENVPFRMEPKVARKHTVSTAEHHPEAESELRTLRSVAQRMILSQEQMEEVVLKRCWLARHWKLCVQHGIHADIAGRKHEYWSSLAPVPVEVVMSAGEKARDASFKHDAEEKPFDIDDLAGEGNIENMLLVEKGLRELVSLKVEDAVLIAMAQHRRTTMKTGGVITIDSSNPVEAFELSKEEIDDVLFKQAWLAYFWRRVKNHGLEEDIADDRLQFWIDQSNKSPNSQDAVEVERGLIELKKLGIETQLWEASRRATNPDWSNRESPTASEI